MSQHVHKNEFQIIVQKASPIQSGSLRSTKCRWRSRHELTPICAVKFSLQACLVPTPTGQLYTAQPEVHVPPYNAKMHPCKKADQKLMCTARLGKAHVEELSLEAYCPNPMYIPGIFYPMMVKTSQILNTSHVCQNFPAQGYTCDVAIVGCPKYLLFH